MSRGENIVSADDVDAPMGELGIEMPLSTVYCRPPPTKPPLEAAVMKLSYSRLLMIDEGQVHPYCSLGTRDVPKSKIH